MVLPNFNNEHGLSEYLTIPKSTISALEYCKLGAYGSWFLTFQVAMYALTSGEDLFGLTLLSIIGLFFIYSGYLIYRGNRPLSLITCLIMIYLGFLEIFIIGKFSITKILFPVFSIYGVIGTFKYHQFKILENKK